MRRVWVSLIFAAALTLWLWRLPSGTVAENDNGETNHSAAPGYVASGAELIDTNAEGQPEFRMGAERIEQPGPAADGELASPQVGYAGQSAWTRTSQRGVLAQSNGQVFLTGDVRATAARSGQLPG